MVHIEKNKKVLIISDIHQNIGSYVEPILEREKDWDYIILNGDYFDTLRFPDGALIYGMGQTCAWINEKFKEWGDRAIWHVGNHDVSYLASYTKNFINTRGNPNYFCSGWTRSKAKEFNKEISNDWINSTQLATRLGDNTIVSHAGFTWDHMKYGVSEIDSVGWYDNEWAQDRFTFSLSPNHWIWDVGSCRGGDSSVGSPVWLDWNSEFVPLDTISQIVGHTTAQRPHRVKYNGVLVPNYNIDEMQNAYMIWDKGAVEVKRLYGK